METEKDTKWYLVETIEAGRKSLLLLNSYGGALQSRLKTDEVPQHRANVEELATRVSGQKQALADQMTTTQGQEAVIKNLNNVEVEIRNIVRSNNPTPEIFTAFGIGNRIGLTVNGVTTAGNIIVDAYNKFKTWSNDAGILESDIAEVSDLLKLLTDVGKVQDDSIFVRKAKTMDKNTLQRTVEDEVTRLSALGMRQFNNNPSVAAMFEDLIPASHNQKKVGE